MLGELFNAVVREISVKEIFATVPGSRRDAALPYFYGKNPAYTGGMAIPRPAL